MADNRFGKIMIMIKGKQCFYHVLGDSVQYLDLYSLQRKHPELNEYLKIHRYELELNFMRQNASDNE